MEEKTDLRILKTRKALSDAFLVLLCEKRFEDITVSELCDRAMYAAPPFISITRTNMNFLLSLSVSMRKPSPWMPKARRRIRCLTIPLYVPALY